MVTFDKARDAWRYLRAQGKAPSGWPETTELDEYFQLGSSTEPKAICPDPARWGADQYKCLRCGRIWDRDDERPDCGVS